MRHIFLALHRNRAEDHVALYFLHNVLMVDMRQNRLRAQEFLDPNYFLCPNGQEISDVALSSRRLYFKNLVQQFAQVHDRTGAYILFPCPTLAM